MPIIEPANPDSPISQGDVLQRVNLFATENGWAEDGGQSRKYPHDMCLVISRPCVVEHKRNVIVAGIQKYPDQVPKGIDSFDKVLDFLETMRDGVGQPDLFYLGQLPSFAGRYCARFDSLFSIDVPKDVEARAQFARERRVGSLNGEFVRDLHIRIFAAFASLGFDDHGWLSDEDLNWLVTTGQADADKVRLDLQQKRAEKAGRDAEGKQVKVGEIERQEAKLVEIESKIQPFVEQFESRGNAAN